MSKLLLLNDYVIERKEEEGNQRAFLGNGRVELERLGAKNRVEVWIMRRI